MPQPKSRKTCSIAFNLAEAVAALKQTELEERRRAGEPIRKWMTYLPGSAAKAHECPACGSKGLIYLRHVADRPAEIDDDTIFVDGIWSPRKFSCQVCGLDIEGTTELRFADLADQVIETDSSTPVDYFNIEVHDYPLEIKCCWLVTGRPQIYCPCWVGKEHWPDDPDPVLACRDRRLGRFGFQDALDRFYVEPALAIGESFRIVGRVGAKIGVGVTGSTGSTGAAVSPPTMRNSWSSAAAAGLRPRLVAIEIGGRQRRIGFAGTGRDHRRQFIADGLLIVELHLGARAGQFRNSSGRDRNRPMRNWATSGNSNRRRCARTSWKTGRPVR